MRKRGSSKYSHCVPRKDERRVSMGNVQFKKQPLWEAGRTVIFEQSIQTKADGDHVPACSQRRKPWIKALANFSQASLVKVSNV